MSASHSVHTKEAPYYYVPASSPHPARASVSLLITMLGAAAWVNGIDLGKWAVFVGILSLVTVLYFWFGDAIGEGESGLNSKRVDVSYRWSMAWFIFSEVMFFAAFFGSLWYVRAVTTPWLGDMDHRLLLWPNFTPTWPNLGPAGVVESFLRDRGDFALDPAPHPLTGKMEDGTFWVWPWDGPCDGMYVVRMRRTG